MFDPFFLDYCERRVESDTERVMRSGWGNVCCFDDSSVDAKAAEELVPADFLDVDAEEDGYAFSAAGSCIFFVGFDFAGGTRVDLVALVDDVVQVPEIVERFRNDFYVFFFRVDFQNSQAWTLQKDCSLWI